MKKIEEYTYDFDAQLRSKFKSALFLTLENSHKTTLKGFEDKEQFLALKELNHLLSAWDSSISFKDLAVTIDENYFRLEEPWPTTSNN